MEGRKKEKGFTIIEVVISLGVLSAIMGLILLIGQTVYYSVKTDEVVLNSFHVKSYLKTAEGYCKQNGVGRGSFQDSIDGVTYNIVETCTPVANSLYRVSVSVCNSTNTSCKTEESYVSR